MIQMIDNLTTGNTHAVSALNTADWSAAERQIDATLAVAFEQRTANILALMAQTGSPTLRQKYRELILSRMGMETGED